MRTTLITVIRLYQWLFSPLLGPHCRFFPSCSAYALDALRQHRLPRALALSLARVARCHPWHAGGLDPVPAPRASERSSSVTTGNRDVEVPNRSRCKT